MICEQDDVAATLDYYAGLAEGLDSRQYEAVQLGEGQADFRTQLLRDPLGVVAAITPWCVSRAHVHAHMGMRLHEIHAAACLVQD
jgi:hypothetical protein